ncbi:MAG: DNA-formamidopyrimidine glycosylase family protein [Candidatus Aminicenantes bacterium]
MPELPDVEVFRQYMEATSLHKKITGVEVENERVLQDITPSGLGQKLKGRLFERTRRHGKHMFACADGEFWVMFHFGMTGFFKYFKNEEDKPPHARVLFHFDNGFCLAYDSQRMLGKIRIVEDAGDFIRQNELGQDALGLSWDAFQNRMHGRRGTVKTALMNQSLMAGIGNIYSDEILFQTGIHPKTQMNNLNEGLLKKMHEHMQRVLKTAVDKKADPEEFPDDFLVPHRGSGNKCPRCGGEIKKVKVNNRGTYFCPQCQPSPHS